MGRVVCGAWIVAGLAGLALGVPEGARADVLEVGAWGSSWVAGGPEGLAGGPEGLAGGPEGLVGGAGRLPSGSVVETRVDGAAGPAAWRARVAQLAAKYDVSASLLEALVWQESRWREGAVSPVGARGLAQLMPGTARQLGVDASDPSANLEGGARYLRMQLDAFGGDIEKALAAYNAGPGRVQAARGVPAIRETQNYVTAILGRLSTQDRR